MNAIKVIKDAGRMLRTLFDSERLAELLNDTDKYTGILADLERRLFAVLSDNDRLKGITESISAEKADTRGLLCKYAVYVEDGILWLHVSHRADKSDFLPLVNNRKILTLTSSGKVRRIPKNMITPLPGHITEEICGAAKGVCGILNRISDTLNGMYINAGKIQPARHTVAFEQFLTSKGHRRAGEIRRDLIGFGLKGEKEARPTFCLNVLILGGYLERGGRSIPTLGKTMNAEFGTAFNYYGPRKIIKDRAKQSSGETAQHKKRIADIARSKEDIRYYDFFAKYSQ